MSKLKREYEVSLWRDMYDDGELVEEKLAVIGAQDMSSPFKTLEPQLKRKVNGSNEFTFKMHRTIIDTVTGEKVVNPFIDQLINEAKIKVHYKNRWYDLYIKDVKADSNNSTFTYTASDVHINELSKLGYDLTLDIELMNNTGTADELLEKILDVEGGAPYGWTVGNCEELVEYREENLIHFTRPRAEESTLLENVYAFYSCCKDKPEIFQYLYFNGGQIDDDVFDDDGVIRKPELLHELTQVQYIAATTGIGAACGLSYPKDWNFVEVMPARGERKVYTHRSKYNSILDKVVYQYEESDASTENDLVWGYTDTEYTPPNLITNYINNNQFLSTDGWTENYIVSNVHGKPGNMAGSTLSEYYAKYSETKYRAKASVTSLDVNGEDLIEDYWKKGKQITENNTFFPTLVFDSQVQNTVITSTLVDNGFHTNRKAIKNLHPRQKFVLLYKPVVVPNTSFPSFKVGVGELDYDVDCQNYTTNLLDLSSFCLVFDSETNIEVKTSPGYYYCVAEVKPSYDWSEQRFLNSKIKTFIFGKPTSDSAPVPQNYRFQDLQIFPFVPKSLGSDVPILPIDEDMKIEAAVNKTYHYYYESVNQDKTDKKEFVYAEQTNNPSTRFEPVTTDKKVRSVSVKQTNIFNAIQTLCETFDCWADFEAIHNDEGRILRRKVNLHKYVGADNHVGFRNGINLKSSNRTVDSKQIVSKLIVADGVNEFAENGFCTIARAGANVMGDNVIYNFDYFVKMGLLNRTLLDEISGDAEIPLDSEGSPRWSAFTTNSIKGYYTKLEVINKRLRELSDIVSQNSIPLSKAISDLTAAEAGLTSAQEKYSEAVLKFEQEAGFRHDTLEGDQVTQVTNSSILSAALQEISEYYTAISKYQDQVVFFTKQKEECETNYNSAKDESKQLNELKKAINATFTNKFSRFLQEGTWHSADYTDDNKYYADALQVSADSAFPKVTYSFSVLDLSGLEGYESFEMQLGDRTWAEDPEFFGYNTDGTPYRQEIVITETTENFNDPSKDSIKAQTYKNQFQDLFQKITATTQTVSYDKDSWNKAANYTNASDDEKAESLQGALNSSELTTVNNANRSVIQDKDGLTIVNLLVPAQKLRLTAGNISFSEQKEDGSESWKAAIDGQGIHADAITTGRLDTSLIQIMNRGEPTFRWDALGINAYHFNENESINKLKAVRFDRFGIYGYDHTIKEKPEDEEKTVDWSPKSLDEIRNDTGVTFALTWDGLLLRPGMGNYTVSKTTPEGEKIEEKISHKNEVFLGCTSDDLYNKWIEATETELRHPEYVPGLDATPFAKIFSVTAGGKENFSLYDDGTLMAGNAYISGTIDSSNGHIGMLFMDENGLYGKYYTEVPNPEVPGSLTDGYYYSGFSMKGNYTILEKVGSDTVYQDDQICFFAGAPKRDGLNSNFCVRNDGIMFAAQGSIGPFGIGYVKDAKKPTWWDTKYPNTPWTQELHRAIYATPTEGWSKEAEYGNNFDMLLCPGGVKQQQESINYPKIKEGEITGASDVNLGNLFFKLPEFMVGSRCIAHLAPFYRITTIDEEKPKVVTLSTIDIKNGGTFCKFNINLNVSDDGKTAYLSVESAAFG